MNRTDILIFKHTPLLMVMRINHF